VEDLSTDRKIILTQIFKEICSTGANGLMWFRVYTSGGLLTYKALNPPVPSDAANFLTE